MPKKPAAEPPAPTFARPRARIRTTDAACALPIEPQGPTQYICSSEVSRLTGIPQMTVIRYANIGVITPIRDNTGRRLFTHADVAKIVAHRATAGRWPQAPEA